MLRPILFLARTDVHYMLRQRETLLWTFVMPVIFMYFIGLPYMRTGKAMCGEVRIFMLPKPRPANRNATTNTFPFAKGFIPRHP